MKLFAGACIFLLFAASLLVALHLSQPGPAKVESWCLPLPGEVEWTTQRRVVSVGGVVIPRGTRVLVIGGIITEEQKLGPRRVRLLDGTIVWIPRGAFRP